MTTTQTIEEKYKHPDRIQAFLLRPEVNAGSTYRSPHNAYILLAPLPPPAPPVVDESIAKSEVIPLPSSSSSSEAANAVAPTPPPPPPPPPPLHPLAAKSCVPFVFAPGCRIRPCSKVSFVDALLKIVDELLINVTDQRAKFPDLVNKLTIELNEEEGWMSIENNGPCVSLGWHTVEKMHVPQLVLGTMDAGENFNDHDNRFGGGRNGLGAKLANLCSTKFVAHLVCGATRTQYVQTWTNNMRECQPPVITTLPKPESRAKKHQHQDSFKLMFWPDFEFLHMGKNGWKNDPQTLSVIYRRFYEIAGTSTKYKRFPNEATGDDGEMYPPLVVTVNGYTLPVTTFKEFANMCVANPITKWYARTVDPVTKQFMQVIVGENPPEVVAESKKMNVQSYVNNVNTVMGGPHLAAVKAQILPALNGHIETLKSKLTKTEKSNMVFDAKQIEKFVVLLVNLCVVNPAFKEQSKWTFLNSKLDCPFSYQLPASFLGEDLREHPGVRSVLNVAADTGSKKLNETDGKKSPKVDLDEKTRLKYKPAGWAGTKRSNECILIIVEGDSAANLAEKARDVLGGDRVGVFPLKGKFTNVRGMSIEALNKNVEFVAFKKIFGLKNGVRYTSPNQTNYGKVFIMTDQDFDGAHICALLLNAVDCFWHSLLELGMVYEFVTPVVKARLRSGGKNQIPLEFLDNAAYVAYARAHPEINDDKKWFVKHYKGLGTHTSHEALEYFHNLQKYLFRFTSNGTTDREALDIFFNGKRAKDRVALLERHPFGEERVTRDPANPTVSLSAFVSGPLVQMAHYANSRSMKSTMDGLSTQRRKILYYCLNGSNKTVGDEIKTLDIVGQVIAKYHYDHGGASLEGGIVGMAQNYVGHQNINLLKPVGQYGSKLKKKASACRYLSTAVTPIARAFFRPEDDGLVPLLYHEGTKVEPPHLLPVAPLGLLNPSEGIGVAHSSESPPFGLPDVVEIMKTKIPLMFDANGQIATTISTSSLPTTVKKELVPVIRGYRGKIVLDKSTPNSKVLRWKVSGVCRVLDDTRVEITEIPPDMTAIPYMKFLTGLYTNGTLAEPPLDRSTEWNLNFVVTFAPGVLRQHLLTPAAEASSEQVVPMTNSTEPSVVKQQSVTEMDVKPLHTVLKLDSWLSASNIKFWDERLVLRKYNSPEEVLDDFMRMRAPYYPKRKQKLVNASRRKATRLSNRARFMTLATSEADQFKVRNVPKATILQMLWDHNFELIPPQKKELLDTDDLLAPFVPVSKATTTVKPDASELKQGYDYLLTMPMWDMTQERVRELESDFRDEQVRLTALEKTTPQQMWLSDLDELVVAYHQHNKDWLESQVYVKGEDGKSTTASAASTKKRRRAPSKKKGGGSIVELV